MAKKVKRGKRGPKGTTSSKSSAIMSGKKKAKPAKVFIYALALAALGGGGFLVYDRVKRKKQGDESTNADSGTIIINNNLPTGISTASRLLSSSTSRNDNFPLKRGSQGERVKTLQQALLKTSPGILIDGQFGPQTASALKTAGYAELVDQTLFNKITGDTGAMTLFFNPSTLATSLYNAAQAKDLMGVLSSLKQMKSVTEYSSVNEYYKKQTLISKTIVTDLLEYVFKYDEPAKAQIKNEFLRIGLKVNTTGTWSLQGIRLYKDLITIRETVVTDTKNNKIPVRRSTILGDEIEVSNGLTWFKSIDNSILTVPTQDVKYV